VTYGPASIGHVIDQNGNSFLDVTDEHHSVDLVRLFPFLVNQRELHVQAIRYRRDAGNRRL